MVGVKSDKSGNKIHFDLTYIDDLHGVLSNTGNPNLRVKHDYSESVLTLRNTKKLKITKIEKES